MRALAPSIALTAAALGVLAASSVMAAEQGRLPPGIVGYATADSRYSGQSVTGPVRRGDASGVSKHLATLKAKAPELIPLYVACAEAQLPLARALGDAPAEAYDAVERALK